MHSQKFVHSQYMLRSAFTVHSTYCIIVHCYAFKILCILGCCIPLHVHAFWIICILVVLHSCAFSRPHAFSCIPRGVHFYNCTFIVHVHAFNDCAFLSSCIMMHLRFFAFSWMHSVASRCILCYLHSRPCAYKCIRSHSITRCIIMHVRFMHYYAFVILCILVGCIMLHLVALRFICIHDLAHTDAYDRIQ